MNQMYFKDAVFKSFTWSIDTSDKSPEQAKLADWFSIRREPSDVVEFMNRYINETKALLEFEATTERQRDFAMGIAYAQRSLADSFRTLNPEAAISLYDDALSNSRELRDANEQSECMSGLSLLAYESGYSELSNYFLMSSVSACFADGLRRNAIVNLVHLAGTWERTKRPADAATLYELVAGMRGCHMYYLVCSANLLKRVRKKKRLREWREAHKHPDATVWDTARSAAACFCERDFTTALQLGQILAEKAKKMEDESMSINFASFLRRVKQAIAESPDEAIDKGT
jgi:hypothetical protein